MSSSALELKMHLFPIIGIPHHFPYMAVDCPKTQHITQPSITVLWQTHRDENMSGRLDTRLLSLCRASEVEKRVNVSSRGSAVLPTHNYSILRADKQKAFLMHLLTRDFMLYHGVDFRSTDEENKRWSQATIAARGGPAPDSRCMSDDETQLQGLHRKAGSWLTVAGLQEMVRNNTTASGSQVPGHWDLSLNEGTFLITPSLQGFNSRMS